MRQENKRKEIRKVGSIGSLICFGGIQETNKILGDEGDEGKNLFENANSDKKRQPERQALNLSKGWREIENFDDSEEDNFSDNEKNMFTIPILSTINRWNSDNESEGDLFDSLDKINKKLNSNTAELI